MKSAEQRPRPAARATPSRPRGRATRAARRRRACRARTRGRRRRRAGWRPSSPRAGGRGRAARRSSTARPAAAPRSRRRPRSRPARPAAPRSRATVRVSTPSQARNESPRSGPARDAPAARLEADEPAAGGGDADRAAAVVAVRHRQHARRPPRRPSRRRSRRACARGPTGCGSAPRVARLGGRQDPELRHVRGADDDEAGVAQAPHQVGAVARAGGRRGTSSRSSCTGRRPGRST